jgi:MFS family permease
LALILGDRILKVTVLTTAVASGAAAVDNVAAPFKFISDLHSGSIGFGVYLALWAIGGLVSIQLFNKLSMASRAIYLVNVGNMSMGLGIAGIGVAQELPLAMGAAVVGGAGNNLSGVSESVVVQSRIPEYARGRVFGTMQGFNNGAVAVGTFAGAPLVSFFGPSSAMLIAGSTTVGGAIIGLVVLPLASGASRRRQEANPSQDPEASASPLS